MILIRKNPKYSETNVSHYHFVHQNFHMGSEKLLTL